LINIKTGVTIDSRLFSATPKPKAPPVTAGGTKTTAARARHIRRKTGYMTMDGFE